MVSSSAKWLRTLLRVGKTQRRSTQKLVKTLFATPAAPAAKPRAKPRPKAAAQLKPKPKAKAAPKPNSAPTLPGKWLASYYTAAADPGGMAARRISYWLYLPSAAASPQGLPLVVMLHGCEQSATQFAQGTRMNRLAEQKGYAVLYPQQSLRAHPRRCWKWYDKAAQQGGGDTRLIVGAIEQVLRRHAIDRSRIYIAGMSAGAGMADIVALRHPDLIAAVGLHSGPVFGAAVNMIGALGVMQHGAAVRADAAIDEVLLARPGFPALPAILIHGDDDKVVRPVNQTQLMRQSILLNRMPNDTEVIVDSKPAGAPGGADPAHAHQIRDFQVGKKLLLRLVKIERLEHAWSGGDADLAFNCQAGPDASKLMLDFFARHRRLPEF